MQDINGGISEAQYLYFRQKTILFIVPHQDDEINMFGGLLNWLADMDCDIYMLYTTNGDYRYPASVRIKEVKEALALLGVHENKIIFLGYPDQQTEEDTHLYMEADSWTSSKGYTETYLTDLQREYCFKKNGQHHILNRQNFINDIACVIEELQAKIVFSVDMDSHADHRAASLGFEQAMGIVLKKNSNYRPDVYKCFAYPTAFNGYSDFYEPILYPCKFKTEPYSLFNMQNPYLNWENRTTFSISEKARKRFLPMNIKFQAMLKHKSQGIAVNSDRIINYDEVAWKRRTDSLTFNARIEVSTGERKYLNDFMYFDCSDIMHGDTRMLDFDRGIWVPSIEDRNPFVRFVFDEEKEIEELILYSSAYYKDKITEIEIKSDCNLSGTFFHRDCEELIWKIVFSPKVKARQIEVDIKKKTGPDAGFTEIEIYSDKEERIVFSNTNNNQFPEKQSKLIILNSINKIILSSLRIFYPFRRRCLKVYFLIQETINKIR